MSLIDGVKSLFTPVNRATDGQGVLDELPELKLEMDDEELVRLSDDWEKKYKEYEGEIAKKQEENEKYWKGEHFDGGDEDRPMMDNIIYEAVETFRSLATKKNPEPFVRGDNTEKGKSLAKSVQQMLIFHADRLRLKIKIKTAILYHELYLLAYAKHGWDEVEDDITTSIRRPQNLILDPTATINEEMEHTGQYIGERMEASAKELIKRFPSKKEYITKKVNGKLGTTVKYTEWWSNNPSEYVFWKMDKVILGKAKNPHWNYENTKNTIDEFGNENPESVPGVNHFRSPKAPYTFLATLNLGVQPHNVTSNIGQNLSNQDIINKRNRQIDRNADSMNGGLIVSGERSGLNKNQATDATEALRSGGTIFIPSGSASEAVYRDQAPALPPDVYNQLADKRESLRNIYGVRGSSPSGTMNEQTATGKTIVREQDSDRIGGGISEYLEQFADHIYNWMTQLMYVYYDEMHSGSIIGAEKSLEYVALSKQELNIRLTVSVKEGSLIPDSDIDRANEAIELAKLNTIDPISLFDRLGFSNPKESAERLYQWRVSPDILFPETGRILEQKMIERPQGKVPQQV